MKQKGFLFFTKKGDYTCDNCGIQNIAPDRVYNYQGKDYCIGCYAFFWELNNKKRIDEMLKVKRNEKLRS